MPEEQAFSVLVKIMFDYGLRELFKQNFEDLHCKFYQLERLMQVKKKRPACLCHLEHGLGRNRLMNWCQGAVVLPLPSRVKDRCFCLFVFISHDVMMMPRSVRREPVGCKLGFQSGKTLRISEDFVGASNSTLRKCSPGL